jgi:beta-lactamase regulating signal transducer with metallopeptidase domain
MNRSPLFDRLWQIDWSAAWLDGMWRASWQGAIAIALAWAMAHYCRFLSPRIVCWVWRAACLKMLVALVWAEPVLLAVLPAEQNLEPARSVASSAIPRVRPIDNPATQPVAERAQAPAAIAPRSWLLALWLAGGGVVGLAALGQWILIGRYVGRSVPATSSKMWQVLLEEARALRLSRVPRLGISGEIRGPFLAGMWRPSIVLPADAEAIFSAAELRGLLAHELAHLKRRDLVWNVLPMLAQCCFYFHPVTWLMSRGWGLAQESACDELVLQTRRAPAADYARLLIKCACEHRDLPRASLAAAGVLGNYRNLERRIMAMARVQLPSTLPLCVAATLLALAAIPATIPWRLVAQEKPASGKQNEATPEQLAAMRSESMNQLKMIGLALHNYHGQKKSFPPAAIYDANGKPLLSWRVALLPYLDAQPLYEQFDLTQPWDSPKNKPLIEKMPDVFRCPASKSPAGTTVYLAPRGDFTVFPDGPMGVSYRQITDGTSNTIAVVEVNDELAVPWTKPDDWKVDPAAPSRGLGGHFPGVFLAECCDRAAHAIPADTKPEVLNALFTRRGLEIIEWSSGNPVITNQPRRKK